MKDNMEIVQDSALLRIMELVYRMGFCRGVRSWENYHKEPKVYWDAIEEWLVNLADTIELSYGEKADGDLPNRSYYIVLAKTPWDKEGLEVVGVDEKLVDL